MRTQILVPDGTLAPAAGFCSAPKPLPTTLRSSPNFWHSSATLRAAQPEKSGTITSGPSPRTTELVLKSGSGWAAGADSRGAGSGLNDAVFTGDVAALKEFRSGGRNPAKTSCFWSGALTGFGVIDCGQLEGLS